MSLDICRFGCFFLFFVRKVIMVVVERRKVRIEFECGRWIRE